MKAVPMKGLRFGRLVVLDLHSSTNRKKFWVCQCDCAAKAVVDGEHLRSGRTVSCGCKKQALAQALGASNKTHGHSTAGGARAATPEYRTWHAMRERCTNPKHKSWKDYGGRGITVFQRWDSFEHFLADMGPRPAGTTIDRFPNNDGNYEPTNCRWADNSAQQKNKGRDPAKMAELNLAREEALKEIGNAG